MENKIVISKGNSKMGPVPSVSLPAITTCDKKAPCYKLCYANKISRLRKNVRDSYENNLKILEQDPSRYWREVKGCMLMSRYFRFHVSGDIPNMNYLRRMIETCKEADHCECICFTKKYDLVNRYISRGGKIPKNLHIIYSAWPGFKMKNPHNFPEAHVRFKDGTTTATKPTLECLNNCTTCALTGIGCWNLKKGQQVVLRQH